MTDDAWREGFAHLHECFARLHQCMDRLDTKLDAVETELDRLKTCMRDGFARIDTRLDRLESRLGQKASRWMVHASVVGLILLMTLDECFM
jgi:tetrahydromethanopterin S-methyltransferase subunit G